MDFGNMKLESKAVLNLMQLCIAPEHEIEVPGVKIVEGIVSKFPFDEGKIQEHSETIREMLMELPVTFREEEGGGWSFLQACQDRHGNQWTGLHVVMETLMCLGVAAGHVQILLPREMWGALPGGMPYFMIKKGKPT
jgi:hypothetical protein